MSRLAHDKHQAVRQRYSYCCGYCGVSEVDVGGELTVDHFRPVSSGGDEDEANLVYCRARCNLYKSDFWPSAADLIYHRRVLHPMQECVEDHLEFDSRTGEIRPLTDAGRFHVSLLQLNRQALVAHRLQKSLLALLIQKQKLLEAEILQLRATVSAQDEYVTHLRSLLGLPTD